MNRRVKIHGKTFMLYRVDGFDNAWCSDRDLALQIQSRRKQFLEELNSDAGEVREVAVKGDWSEL
ncbi:MAG: hypothetical protein ACE5E2_01850 [Candidatus Binatia bacterium]